MNDQTFLQRVGVAHAAPVRQDGHDEAAQPARRFRRGAARRANGPEMDGPETGGIAMDHPANARQLPDPSVPSGPSASTSAGTRAVLSLPLAVVDPAMAAPGQWDGLRLASPGVRRHFLSGAPLVNFFRADPAARAFDLLRTRLLHTLRANGWSRIAIAAPTPGCGSTFTAVNLAQSLARIPGSRSVLLDLNQRKPGIAAMLEMEDAGDMPGFLCGDVPVERHLVRISKTLALGLASGPVGNAAEILHDARSAATLARMTQALRPDVVLYDLPPILAHDDLAAFLPQVDGVLLVADGTKTLARQIAACEKILNGQTQVLGVILNRARGAGLEG